MVSMTKPASPVIDRGDFRLASFRPRINLNRVPDHPDWGAVQAPLVIDSVMHASPRRALNGEITS